MSPRLRSEHLRDLREHAAAIDLAALIDAHGSPLVIIDPARARAALDRLHDALPFARLHYAVTALPHPAIVRAVWGHADFTLSHVRELDLLQAAGVPADGAILSALVLSPAEIARAHASGVRGFVVDGPAEVDKLADAPKDLRVSVRLAVTDDGLHGVQPGNLVDLVRYALSLGVNVSGIAIQLPRADRTAAGFAGAVRRALSGIDAVERALGVRLGTLDLGGGIDPDDADTVAVLRSLLAPRSPGLTVLAEPGRTVADAAIVHVSRVIGQSTRAGTVVQHLDDGVGGSFSPRTGAPLLFSLAEVVGSTERLRPASVVGPSGAEDDVIARGLLLPPLGVGDIVIGRGIGAYAPSTALGAHSDVAVVVADDGIGTGIAPAFAHA